MLQNPHIVLTFDKIDNPLHLPRGTTSEHPKVVRTPNVFNMLTSKCASRHNGVHFFDISTSKRSKSRLAKAAGAEPAGQMRDEKLHAVVARSTFRSQHVQSTAVLDPLEKHGVSRLSYLFAHLHLLSSDSFSSTLLSSNLSLLSASALLCFLSVRIVGSLTSKLPSIISLFFRDETKHPETTA